MMNWSTKYVKESGLWKDVFGSGIEFKDLSQCRVCNKNFWDAKNPTKTKWDMQAVRDSFAASDGEATKRSPNDDTICTNCVRSQ
jgi:hypothetical protein